MMSPCMHNFFSRERGKTCQIDFPTCVKKRGEGTGEMDHQPSDEKWTCKYSACIVTSRQHGFVGSLSKKKHKHTTIAMLYQTDIVNITYFSSDKAALPKPLIALVRSKGKNISKRKARTYGNLELVRLHLATTQIKFKVGLRNFKF